MNAQREQPMAYCEGECGTLVRAENRVCMRCAEKIRSNRPGALPPVRPAAVKGVLDWDALPNRVMVDECEGGEAGPVEMLAIVGAALLVLVCSLTGALVLGAAMHGAVSHGSSLTEFGHQVASRLRP